MSTTIDQRQPTTQYDRVPVWAQHKEPAVTAILVAVDSIDSLGDPRTVAIVQGVFGLLGDFALPMSEWVALQLIEEIRTSLDEAQRIEDGDLDARSVYDDPALAIGHLRFDAVSAVEYALVKHGYTLRARRVAS